MSEYRWDRALSILLASSALLTLGVTPGRARAPALSGSAAGSRVPCQAPLLRWNLRASSPRVVYRLLDRADPSGRLVGWRLELVVGDGHIRRSRDLPVESSVAGPFGGAVIVTVDDGSRSTVESFDALSGCRSMLVHSPDVVRRATVDRSGGALYLALRERETRRDLGVWRRPVRGGRPSRVVPPLAEGPGTPFGRTFSTELVWSTDGSRLAVHSCAAADCRTRLVDQAGGTNRLVDPRGAGDLVGLTGDEVVTYLACGGLPCPIVSTDARTGRRHWLGEAIGAARTVRAAGQDLLVYEAHGLGGPLLRAVAVNGGQLRWTRRLAPTEWLLPVAPRSLAGWYGWAGWLPLTRPGDAHLERLPVRLIDPARPRGGWEGVTR